MPVEIIPSFLLYCLVSGITPGPANLCSLSVAIRFGRSVALRQWRGIFTGYAIVSFVSGVLACFLGNALNEYVNAFSFVGAAYIVWLAFKMLRAKYESGEDENAFADGSVAENAAGSFGFKSGVLVQLTNVKIMIFCITAQTSFLLPYNQSFAAVMLLAAFLPLTGPMCNMVWLLTGVALRRFFAKYQKWVNLAMFVALLACAIKIFDFVL